MHRLEEVPADSVFFHTFGYFLRHRPFTTAYGNDFARWAALEIGDRALAERLAVVDPFAFATVEALREHRSEEHTSELQSRLHLVCRLLLEKKTYHPCVLFRLISTPFSLSASSTY